MPIPRFEDEKNGMPYELYWFCPECGWAITTNPYNIGKERCILCDSPTKRLRVEYPQLCTNTINNYAPTYEDEKHRVVSKS